MATIGDQKMTDLAEEVWEKFEKATTFSNVTTEELPEEAEEFLKALISEGQERLGGYKAFA